MTKKLPLLFILFCYSILSGQTFPITIIDDTSTSGGITKIISGDINNDTFNDIIISQGYNIGNISFYLNDGEGNFGTKTTIDFEALFAEGLAIGDFDNDGWNDIVSISRQTGTVAWYKNTNGSFSTSLIIDTEIFFLNDIVVADFDADGSEDIVVIGQHSIDLFRNDGNGVFTKEAILTTSTSPNILECMSLEKADFDNDGDMDLIVGETLGPVVYFNNGLGIFTPETLQNFMLTTPFSHPFDIDGDGDLDVFSQDSTGMTKWFSNDGQGNFTFVSNLFTLGSVSLRSLEAIDVNNDGFKDAYYAYSNKAVYRLNDGNGNFGIENIIYQNTSLFMREVAIGDLDNDNFADYIWAAVNQTMAYHKHIIPLEIHDLQKIDFTVFPNPTEGALYINSNESHEVDLKILTLNGSILKEYRKHNLEKNINISDLEDGFYFLVIDSNNLTFVTKLIKQ